MATMICLTYLTYLTFFITLLQARAGRGLRWPFLVGQVGQWQRLPAERSSASRVSAARTRHTPPNPNPRTDEESEDATRGA